MVKVIIVMRLNMHNFLNGTFVYSCAEFAHPSHVVFNWEPFVLAIVYNWEFAAECFIQVDIVYEQS